jgi:hypothetical protein
MVNECNDREIQLVRVVSGGFVELAEDILL